MNKSGFVIVTENGLYGLQDANGREVVPCEYDKILDYDDDGYIRLLKGEVYSTVSIEGERLSPCLRGLPTSEYSGEGRQEPGKAADGGL